MLLFFDLTMRITLPVRLPRGKIEVQADESPKGLRPALPEKPFATLSAPRPRIRLLYLP